MKWWKAWVYVWLFWVPPEKEELLDIILPYNRSPTTTPNKLLISESTASCLLGARRMSFTSHPKGVYYMLSTEFSDVPFTYSRCFPRGKHFLFCLCQIIILRYIVVCWLASVIASILQHVGPETWYVSYEMTLAEIRPVSTYAVAYTFLINF